MNRRMIICEYWREDLAKCNASNKAREDINWFLREEFELLEKPINPDEVKGSFRLLKHINIAKQWDNLLTGCNPEDLVLIQYPTMTSSPILADVIKRHVKRGVYIVLLVHDVNSLRRALNTDVPIRVRTKMRIEEARIMRSASGVIAHNRAMKEKICKLFKLNKQSVFELGLFDYKTVGSITYLKKGKDDEIVIAGNLSPEKAGYINKLPRDVNFSLYGVGYENIPTGHLEYKGSFDPDIGPQVISGSFGLVWDGASTLSCSGIYGEYLRFNNPHKASLYLAAGIPLIVWDQSALAPLVKDKNIGLTVACIDDIRNSIDKISDLQYEQMVFNTRLISEKIRTGYFTKTTISIVENSLFA